jgi:phosphohistidine swiveling domain-containing protein
LLAPLQQLKLQRALAAARVPAPIQSGRLLEALQIDIANITITTWTEHFLAVYETVFLTNIATQQELTRLDPILARTQISVSSLLSSKCAAEHRLDLSDVRHFCDSSWQGNGLDVADSSPFIMRGASEKEYQETEADRWWQALTSLSRSAYEPVIRAAVQADQLREVGRWVTVRWIHLLRTRILARAQTEGLGIPEAFQIRLEEWEQGLPSDEERRERVNAYTRSLAYRLPTLLTNLPIQEEKVLRGLSAGITEGTLTLPEALGLMTSATPVILLVEQLRPELAPFLSQVQGIVTARGGMLSHLAILAREEHIPVVSGVLYQELLVRLGTRVRIDGGKGHIEILGRD